MANLKPLEEALKNVTVEIVKAMDIKIVVKDVKCPKCGAGEMHPDGKHVLIRGFKVCDDKGYWWSQCLICAGAYDENLVPVKNWNTSSGKGWF
jgi:hypothetical protein